MVLFWHVCRLYIHVVPPSPTLYDSCGRGQDCRHFLTFSCRAVCKKGCKWRVAVFFFFLFFFVFILASFFVLSLFFSFASFLFFFFLVFFFFFFFVFFLVSFVLFGGVFGLFWARFFVPLGGCFFGRCIKALSSSCISLSAAYNSPLGGAFVAKTVVYAMRGAFVDCLVCSDRAPVPPCRVCPTGE